MSCIDGHEFESNGSVQIGEHLVSVTYKCVDCGEKIEDEAFI